jgi:glycosyltransferase involved in cell wall biosynthesis
VYAGLHGLCQGLEQVIAAARLVKEEKIRIILIGDGPEKAALLKGVTDQRISNVDFYPPVSQEQITSILASMDAALIVLKSHIRGAVPSKIYEAMASGVPIILAADGEAARIVRKTGAGVTVGPGNIEELATALRQIATDASLRRTMGEAGRRAAETHYDRKEIAEKFEILLQSTE